MTIDEKVKKSAEDFAVNEPSWGATRVHRAVVKEHGAGAVSLRSVGELVRQARTELPEAARQDLLWVYWPDSFGSGPDRLPWQAGPAVLELLNSTLGDGRRPSMALARCFWQVSAAAPGLTFWERRLLASHLQLARRMSPADRDATHRDVERALAGLSSVLPDLSPGFLAEADSFVTRASRMTSEQRAAMAAAHLLGGSP